MTGSEFQEVYRAIDEIRKQINEVKYNLNLLLDAAKMPTMYVEDEDGAVEDIDISGRGGDRYGSL